jgi:two-component system response regulator MprA
MAWLDYGSTVSAQPQVLVVEDDTRIAAALRRALIYEGYQVEVAPDGPVALTRARERVPDLVILDVMLPRLDGLEVCKRLRAAGDVPILMLTAKDGTADRVRGLDSGADDYLVKPFAYEELLARVRALLRRSTPRRKRTLRYADVTMDLAAHEVRRGERLIALTAKEFELLQHLLTNPRIVLSREQLMDAVWGLEFGAQSNVVDVYVGYLRQKLENGDQPRLLQTVRGVGYVLREE